MMAVRLKSLPLPLALIGAVLAVDLLAAVVGGLTLSDQLFQNQDRLDMLRSQAEAKERAASEGQAAQASAEQLKELVAPLVLTGKDGLPPRLALVKAIDAQRLLHETEPLHYRLSPEQAEPLAGSALEQVARPVEIELSADKSATLAAFWQDLLDKLPGRSRLDSFEIEKTAQGAHGQIALRQLSLRPMGSGGDVP